MPRARLQLSAQVKEYLDEKLPPMSHESFNDYCERTLPPMPKKESFDQFCDRKIREHYESESIELNQERAEVAARWDASPVRHYFDNTKQMSAACWQSFKNRGIRMQQDPGAPTYYEIHIERASKI
jgi:hypothetical protein